MAGGPESNQSCLPTVEVNNTRNYTSTLPHSFLTYKGRALYCVCFPPISSALAEANSKLFTILHFNLLNPTGHVMHQQFNIQQLHVLPTLYLCVLYLSENKQRLVPLTA